jgi:hypothetical protein
MLRKEASAVGVIGCCRTQTSYIVHMLALVISIALPSSLLGKQAGSNAACAAGMPMQDFYVNVNGDITNAGRSREGPVCVQVHYNRLRFNLSVNFQTTYSKGPEAGTVLLTGSAPTAAPGGIAADPREAQLNAIVTALGKLDTKAQKLADGVKNVSDMVTFVDNNIGPGKAFPDAAVKDKYKAVQDPLRIAQTLQNEALPTDLTFGTCPPSPGTPTPGSVLATLQSFQSDRSFYEAHKPNIDSALVLANLYRCGAVSETELARNIIILKFWDTRFRELGLRNDMTDAQLQQLSLAAAFIDSAQLTCPNIFNQSSSTAASMTVFDESQTLSGDFSAPSAHQNLNFFSLTCASPFAVSAGIEFSTIPAREFGIIKSAGGANNTSIDKFGLTSDSAVHPLPVALVHVRLWESMDHRFAFHASAGASGNIQGQSSGGSSAEFLTGGSLSFFRTMFISAGLHIGTKSILAGGFNVGDTVPSDISSVQVTKSYTTGVGFAITFTKP